MVWICATKDTRRLPSLAKLTFSPRASRFLPRLRSLAIVTALLTILATGCTWLNLAQYLATEVPSPTLPDFDAFSSFTIDDPYAVPGEWYKVQLHIHTANSTDSSWPVKEALEAYAQAGYDAVAITDHNVVTQAGSPPDSLLVIQGEENTLPSSPYPFGLHAVFLGVDTHVTGWSVGSRFEQVTRNSRLVMLAHPHWPGNLGTGTWELWQALTAPQFQLVEIVNPHSSPTLDEQFWHTLIAYRGPDAPTWATAVDDAHSPADINFGWIMVKAESLSTQAILEALRRGSHYPTTGLTATFGVEEDAIYVTAQGIIHIEFIDGKGNVVLKTQGDHARYLPTGSEGFVRLRLSDPVTGSRAWSQPFWLRASF